MEGQCEVAEHQVTHVSEEITPALAEKYLKNNRFNRKVIPWRINLLADDMTAGHFPENGENGVTFDWNNNIAAGQHTLHAIVRSGKTLRLRVTRGVDPAARTTMNDSAKQRLSHDLQVWGISNASAAESLLRKIMVWETAASRNKGQGGLTAWRTMRFSRSGLATAWPRYATGVSEAITGAGQWLKDWPHEGNSGALYFMYWLLTEKHGFNSDKVTEFFNVLTYGSQDPDVGTLVAKIRRKFSENDWAEVQVFWMCRVWNAYTGGEKLSKLQAPKGGKNPGGKTCADLGITDPYPKLNVVH